MGSFDKELVNQSTQETTDRILKIIKDKYEKTPSGKIQGYIFLSDVQDVLSKEDVRKIQVRRKDEKPLVRFGSDICKEPHSERCIKIGIMLSQIVHYKLMVELSKYPFKKIDIYYTDVPEYQYDPNKLLKYRKTRYVIPLFKVNIKW